MNLEEISEKYFGNTKVKHLKHFNETTPKGNVITGYINQKPNYHLGSLLILSVNDDMVEQYIQSMPKIHYFKDVDDILPHGDVNPCYEKLDGSCLILYPLKNKDGEIIEVVPKTRGKVVADNHFIDLYHKIDLKPINDYYSENDGILIFELYGVLNQHDIIHYTTGIDIRLIGVYEDGEFLNTPFKAKEHNFKLPDKLFELYNEGSKWYLHFTSEKYNAYKPDKFKNDDVGFDSNEDAVLGIKHELEALNKLFYEVNGRIATEGVVINTLTRDGVRKWLKCKPKEIEVKHKSVNGIPKREILKEIYKYFDEYGSEVKEIYKRDEKHHTEYIVRQLSEEYEETYILRSKNRIEKLFMQVWDSREVPESVHNICENLIMDYGSEGISYCMRMFAEKYPQKKKDARLVYGVLEKLFVKNNLEM